MSPSAGRFLMLGVVGMGMAPLAAWLVSFESSFTELSNDTKHGASGALLPHFVTYQISHLLGSV